MFPQSFSAHSDQSTKYITYFTSVLRTTRDIFNSFEKKNLEYIQKSVVLKHILSRILSRILNVSGGTDSVNSAECFFQFLEYYGHQTSQYIPLK